MARVPSVAQTEPVVRPFVTAARKLAVAGRTCAHCGSPEIRPSNRRNALDILLACLFLAPFRCRICRQRFYRVWRPSLQRPPEPPTAPLMTVSPQRKLLNLDSVEPRAIQPEPIHPQPIHPQPTRPRNAEVQMVALPSPQKEIPGVELETAQPVAAAARGPILILESDLSIRKLLRRLLERRGYFTVEVSHPGQLARELRDRPADLLIVDVSATPEIGVDAVVALAREHPSLKILALSAETLQDNEIPGRLLVLLKPFPLDRFVDCVDRLLERSTPP
jgi:CheY-like chemotaxis protein